MLAALALVLATAAIGLDVAAAARPDDGPSRAIAPGAELAVRAKTDYERVFNPFGDDWDAKSAPNVSIPIGLTPACYKLPPKRDAGISPEEVAFLAKSNSPLIWEECADVIDASGPDIAGNVGDPRLRANIAAVKAANPSALYIGYLPIVRADTQIADGSAAPVGLNFIHRNREDWFVHIKGAAPTRENRVKYIQEPSELYDVTNPEFRAFMVARIVESLTFHDLDGFVLAECFDLPTVLPRTPPPDAVVLNWEAGCLAMHDELRVALDPIGKYVFFTGYRHIGSEDEGSFANEQASERFYQQRIDRSHGFFWEDAFRAVTADDVSGEFAFERYKRLRDYAIYRGRLLVNIVNTRAENMSTFASTNHDQQQYLARFFLAAYLAGMAGPRTVMHHYTPISQGEQFFSDTFFREWDLPVGDPLGPDVRMGRAIYQRDFQNARVVFNASSGPFTVNLSDDAFTTSSGNPAGSTAVVPAKSGAIFMKVTGAVVCTPRPPIRVNVSSAGGGTILADITPGATAGSLRYVRIVETRNALVDIDGGPTNISGERTHFVLPGTSPVRLSVRKNGGNASFARLLVTDGCGTWPTFVGAGSGA